MINIFITFLVYDAIEVFEALAVWHNCRSQHDVWRWYIWILITKWTEKVLAFLSTYSKSIALEFVYPLTEYLL